jgi:signal transduction histidine kinase
MMRTALDVAAGKPGGPPPQVAVLAAKVRIGLDRADALLESFLTLARLQRGAAPAWPGEVVSLPGTAAAVLAAQAEPITALSLTIERDLADAPVAGSAVLLTRMTENVIDNAVRHNQPGGWVRVVTSTGGPHAVLVVETGGRVLDQGEVSQLAQRAQPAFLSAEDLLEQVWDEHADPFTNTVFVTISRLRRKLGAPQVIETQPGAGYHIADRYALSREY